MTVHDIDEWSDHHDGVGDCASCGRTTTLKTDRVSYRICRPCWDAKVFGDDE